MKTKTSSYSKMASKMLLRVLIITVSTVVTVVLAYVLFFKGKFAEGMVSVFQNLLRMDYGTALQVYNKIFRESFDVVLFWVVVIFFIGIILLLIRWFSRYIGEINRGIDELLSEGAEDISLLPELEDTEKKLNTIKHSLEKRKQDALFAEQRKNDLVVYLAHDLKTPLTSVIGYLTLLHDEAQISEELRQKHLSISLNKAERLEDLINEFFEITRFNLSTIVLEYSNVNLSLLLEQLAFEFSPMLMEKNLQLKLNMGNNIMLKCDVDKLQRVLDNLLRNAVNYSFPDSVIEITVTNTESILDISFVNNGNTIPKEKLERIFEQFYRLDTARTSKNGGAGLGLAIAKEIITLHGGDITAKSSDNVIQFNVKIPLL